MFGDIAPPLNASVSEHEARHMESNDPALSVALHEYTASQESAQHHDNLIWTTTGLVWTGNFVLLSYVVADGHPRVFVCLASILGLLLTIGVTRAVIVWNNVMNIKYARCREIERLLDMKQHLNVEAAYPTGEMKLWYYLVSAVFAIAWLRFLVCAS